MKHANVKTVTVHLEHVNVDNEYEQQIIELHFYLKIVLFHSY
jgi:hypothetical protein